MCKIEKKVYQLDFFIYDKKKFLFMCIKNSIILFNATHKYVVQLIIIIMNIIEEFRIRTMYSQYLEY
jgi:hypothetical protein